GTGRSRGERERACATRADRFLGSKGDVQCFQERFRKPVAETPRSAAVAIAFTQSDRALVIAVMAWLPAGETTYSCIRWDIPTDREHRTQSGARRGGRGRKVRQEVGIRI